MEDEGYKAATQSLKDRQSDRNKNITAIEELYNMVDKEKKPGYQTTVQNDARVFPDRATHFLSAKPPLPRIVAARETPVVRDTFSEAELGLVGIYRVKDEQYFNTGRISLAWDSARIACLTGHLFRLSCVRKGDGKEPIFLAENWETKDCYPAYGETELRKFLHEYTVAIEVAEEKAELLGWKMPDLQQGTKEVKISDYYEKRKGKILHHYWLDGQLVGELDHPEFDQIPIRGGPMNGGHTILDANAESYRASNRLLSDILEAAHRAVKGLITVYTDRQVVVLDQSDFARGEGIIKHLKPELNEKIVKVDLATVPPEAIAILNWFSAQQQRGGFSYAVYGGMMGEMPSGYALAQLIMGALAVAGPYKVGLDLTDSYTFHDWLKQFKTGGFKAIEVSGNATGKLNGFFHQKFGPKDVPDFQYVYVNRELSFADTRMEDIMMARQAAPQIPQILSRHTLLDQYLRVDDPQAELTRIDEDIADMSEPSQRLALAWHYEQQADVYARMGRMREAQLLRTIAASALAGPAPAKQGVEMPKGLPEYGSLNQAKEDRLRSLLQQPQPQPKQLARRAARQGIELGGKEMP